MRKIITSIAILTASVAAIIMVNLNDGLSECLEYNVEALAEQEQQSGECYKRIVSDSIQKVFYCAECRWVFGHAALLSGKGNC